MKKTLKEIAQDMGYEKYIDESGNMTVLNLDGRYAIMEDEKGLHLTDLVSWARFSPVKIGKKSNVTVKGLQFQLAQFARYKKQIA